MVLTKNQADQFNNGKLSRKDFFNLIDTIDFDKYLLRYCTIISSEKNDFYRIWKFSEFGFTIELEYYLGEFSKIKWYKK